MRTDHLSTNFSGGEWSPRLLGRPDLAKYADSVKLARDVVCMQHGGMRGRPGTDKLGEVKDSSKATRMVPFVYSTTDSYALELGDGYMRVWKAGVLVAGPYELAMPYATADLFSIDYTQGADTMFLALDSKPIYRLRRFSDSRWTVDAAPFDPPPFTEIGRRQSTAITLGSAAVGATTATAGASAFLAADAGRRLTYSGGSALIDSVTGATTADVTVGVAFAGTALPSGSWLMTGSPRATLTPSVEKPVGATVTMTLDINGWRSDDVGSFVQVNGGLVRITAYTDALNADGIILAELTDTTACPPDAWSLESSAWNAVDGYPRTVTLHQQRLIAGGTSRFPQTLWGSRPGLALDFTKGTRDDDSYSFELASDEINPIRFLSSNRDLIALTYGGEWTLNGGIEKPITPTNIRAIPQAKVGCADVRPEQIDNDLYYTQRGVSVLRTVSWSDQFAGYQSAEASTLSEHLVKGGVENITYQQSPERVAWVHKADGTYVAMTVSREQNIRAFTLCTPGGGGVVESMATIPEDGEDKTYMIVRRTINGATKRYVERMNWDAYQDCRVQVTPTGMAISVPHLAGMTVSAIADGVDVGDIVLDASGNGTLPRTASGEVSVGLRFTPKVKLLSAETGTGMGASLGRGRNVSQCAVLLMDTVGCSINGQALAFRQFGEAVLDSPVAPFSGWIDASEFGWEPDADELEITQPQSYPFTLLAVRRRITSNPG